MIKAKPHAANKPSENNSVRVTANESRMPASARADIGMPKLVHTPALGVSLESLDSLIEKRKITHQ